MTSILALTALSPLDGRYAEKTYELNSIFSEQALIHHRLFIELQWLKFLQPKLSQKAQDFIDKIYLDFSAHDAQEIKDLEQQTNHDIKALEYFIKNKLDKNTELKKIREWVHFGCTSDDINNLAYGLMLSTAREKVIVKYLNKLLDKLYNMARDYADVPMVSRTHGQIASPTTVGKEFANLFSRINSQVDNFKNIKIFGKINGAVGNFNAHDVVFPEKNWIKIAQEFVEDLGLNYQKYTTQIEPHDYMAELFHNLIRINNILIDLSRDIWGYISLGVFQQKLKSGETGSSTMPHKVNPIDFENAEGNLYLSNSLLNCLAEKLPVSRYQRDLVDSTLLRNMGVAIGYGVVAYQSLLRGLDKLDINQDKIETELNSAWEVLAEPIQMAMRVNGIDEPYEKLKKLTRGKNITQKILHDFIDGSELPKEIKVKLKKLTPEDYVGYAEKLAKEC